MSRSQTAADPGTTVARPALPSSADAFFVAQWSRIIRGFLLVWTLLQIPRWISAPILSEVRQGRASSIWFVPAILDLLTASLAVGAFLVLIRRSTGLAAWLYLQLFIVFSLLAHLTGIAAVALSDLPVLPGSFGNSRLEVVTSMLLPCVFDLLFLGALISPLQRRKFIFIIRPAHTDPRA